MDSERQQSTERRSGCANTLHKEGEILRDRTRGSKQLEVTSVNDVLISGDPTTFQRMNWLRTSSTETGTRKASNSDASLDLNRGNGPNEWKMVCWGTVRAACELVRGCTKKTKG